jgi:hypothetical protein
MSKRIPILALTAVLAATLAVTLPARAQAPNADPPAPPGPQVPDVPTPPGHPDVPGEPLKPPEPPSELPARHTVVLGIDKLFEALKVAPTDDSAKYVENRIWALWLTAGGDTANMLMTRVKTAMDGKEYDLAIKLLNSIIDIRPNYVEAWNRRATAYYMKKDFVSSMGDIGEVLKLEPRHFGALSGMGMILQELGDEKHALDAFRRALAVHPHLEKIPDLVKKLTEKVEGRNI